MKHQAADALSRMETNGHDTAETDDDLHDDITIGAMADENGTLDSSDAYNDRHPYPDTIVETEAIANVTIRSCKAKVDNNAAQEAPLEA